MRLIEVEFEPLLEPIPPRVGGLLADAQQRLDALDDRTRVEIPAFVPCNFEMVYLALAQIAAQQMVPGHRFIEWGSGMGVVTCLASLLGFDAVGIEIEPRLVGIANELAREHHIDVEFSCGSFLPEGVVPRVDWADGVAWLSTDGVSGYDELGLDPDDFDLVFAYPWPGEEQVLFDVFKEVAATGALLLTYHGLEGVKLHRKMRGRR